MGKIKIEGLSEAEKISKEEMRKVLGGIIFVGSMPDFYMGRPSYMGPSLINPQPEPPRSRGSIIPLPIP